MPAQGLAREPAWVWAQVLAREPAQGLAQEPAQGRARELAQGLAQEPARGPAQGPAQEPAQEQELAQGSAQEPARAPAPGAVSGPVSYPRPVQKREPRVRRRTGPLEPRLIPPGTWHIGPSLQALRSIESAA